LAQKIWADSLSAIRSFDDTPGPIILDGTLFTVSLSSNINSAKAEFGDLSVSKMSQAVRELSRLLHETTHAF
jgi:hypothetical protein